ncbi:MAG: c-type cytochrome [Pedobacter sp.]|nr:MAG: c-type cytochrome [Pedobacter sp.]
MKRIGLALGAFCLILAACAGNDSGTTEESTNSTATTSTAETPKSEGEILIAKSDCIGCHHKVNKVIGPSYEAIAAKYENTPENVTMLAKHIINGSKGVWGTIPMTPHANTSPEEAQKMVSYIMTLKK